MFTFKKIQFTEFRENKALNAYGFDFFKTDLIKKKNKEGILKIFSYNSEDIYTWKLKKYFGKLNFQPQSKEFYNRFFNFKNSTLSLLRRYNVIYINVALDTNQYHKNKEIVESWEYRMILLNSHVILEQLSSETVYNNYIIRNSTPDYHMVYCGPDGKIFGWDKV